MWLNSRVWIYWLMILSQSVSWLLCYTEPKIRDKELTVSFQAHWVRICSVQLMMTSQLTHDVVKWFMKKFSVVFFFKYQLSSSVKFLQMDQKSSWHGADELGLWYRPSPLCSHKGETKVTDCAFKWSLIQQECQRIFTLKRHWLCLFQFHVSFRSKSIE